MNAHENQSDGLITGFKPCVSERNPDINIDHTVQHLKDNYVDPIWNLAFID